MIRTTHPALGRCAVMLGYRLAIIQGVRGRRILYVESVRTHRWHTLPLV